MQTSLTRSPRLLASLALPEELRVVRDLNWYPTPDMSVYLAPAIMVVPRVALGEHAKSYRQVEMGGAAPLEAKFRSPGSRPGQRGLAVRPMRRTSHRLDQRGSGQAASHQPRPDQSTGRSCTREGPAVLGRRAVTGRYWLLSRAS